MRNKAENTWRNSGLEVHKDIYKKAKTNVIRFIENAKSDFYKDKIDNAQNNQKELYKVVNCMLDHNHGVKILPTLNNDDLPTRFSNFF